MVQMMRARACPLLEQKQKCMCATQMLLQVIHYLHLHVFKGSILYRISDV